MAASFIYQGIRKSPTHTGGVRAEHRIDICRYLALHSLQILKHPGACPIDIRSFLEDNVDEGAAEKGNTSDSFNLGRSQEGRTYGVGNLVFHKVRASARPIRVYNYLSVAEVGQGVKGRMGECPISPAHKDHNKKDRNEPVFAA